MQFVMISSIYLYFVNDYCDMPLKWNRVHLTSEHISSEHVEIFFLKMFIVVIKV